MRRSELVPETPRYLLRTPLLGKHGRVEGVPLFRKVFAMDKNSDAILTPRLLRADPKFGHATGWNAS